MKRIIFICIVITWTYWGAVEAEKSTCQEFVSFSSVGVHQVHLTGLIQYRKDEYDSGHGWSRDVGTFTIICPGIYRVSFTGYGDQNTRLILKRRLTSAKNVWEPIVSTPPGGGSVTTIVSMKMGEQIGVFVSGTLRTDIEQPVSVTSFNAHKIN